MWWLTDTPSRTWHLRNKHKTGSTRQWARLSCVLYQNPSSTTEEEKCDGSMRLLQGLSWPVEQHLSKVPWGFRNTRCAMQWDSIKLAKNSPEKGPSCRCWSKGPFEERDHIERLLPLLHCWVLCRQFLKTPPEVELHPATLLQVLRQYPLSSLGFVPSARTHKGISSTTRICSDDTTTNLQRSSKWCWRWMLENCAEKAPQLLPSRVCWSLACPFLACPFFVFWLMTFLCIFSREISFSNRAFLMM